MSDQWLFDGLNTRLDAGLAAKLRCSSIALSGC